MAFINLRRHFSILPKSMFFLLLVSSPCRSSEPVSQGIDPENGLRYWQYEGNDILFRLTQRLPDQTRGYFMARGFGPDDAELIATSCVFQTLFKNTANKGTSSVQIDLPEWRVVLPTRQQSLMVRERWNTIWQQRSTPDAAQIAFEWSLLPSQQSYQPGDYNWGMTSFDLPPGSRFDLQFHWEREGVTSTGTLHDVICADDIHPDTE